MTDGLFSERGHALEEEFFKRRNAELVAAMRAEMEAEHLKDALEKVAGISDEQLLAHFVAMGMTPATFMAAALVPLVAVAWADGELQEAERLRILRDPQTQELNETARALLTNWLIEEPEPSLFQTWIEYIRTLLPQLDPNSREQLKASTLRRAEGVAAAAAGEPYGIGREVSVEEQAVLARIETAFEG